MPPVDEQARLAALQRYRILDTAPEGAFDDLTLLASQICGTPMALITLIDENRQWFKSEHGFDGVRETERSVAFCNHAITDASILEVPDTREDARFRHNPFVTGRPHIRFYAGAPLVTPDGHALGTLCVVDIEPRRLSPGQMRALDALRHQVQDQLELRLKLRQLEQALADRDTAQAEQVALIAELRSSLQKVDKLTALMPYTSACEMNIVIPAEAACIPRVSEGVKQLLEGKGWAEAQIMPVELALDEALANAIRHGCKDDPTKQVQCIVTTDATGEVMIAVRDPGPGFEPSTVPNPLEGENMFKGSGRGVFLINQLMDEVGFADGGREVQMRKRRA
ncbi:MAG TPA: ATP-binding protein [Vicinamibacterales bacterium]|jgi:anti-sigma regulatory factor (Ser/Thr protein kinase)|nr:ATP-binding protein [Vicinamibacterales bacterium]